MKLISRKTTYLVIKFPHFCSVFYFSLCSTGTTLRTNSVFFVGKNTELRTLSVFLALSSLVGTRLREEFDLNSLGNNRVKRLTD